MKKKTFSFIVIAIILALIIVIVAQYYPPTENEDNSGTIGKVDKYRKVQMTEKDVILRSQFVSDTTALAKSIRGLAFFNAFSKDYAKDLKVYSDYLKQNEPKMMYVTELEGYISFINNNSNTVENTIGLLLDFYSGDTTNFSLDVEKKLKDFDSFVYQMLKKDSVIVSLIPELETKIAKGNSGNKKDDELIKLKNIHDQMILKNMQLYIVVGSSEKLNIFFNKSLYNVNNIGILIAGPKIDGYYEKQLNIILSKDKLGIFNKEKLGLTRLNKERLGTRILSNEKLGYIFNREKFNSVFILNKEKLNYTGWGAKVNQLGLHCYNSINPLGLLFMNKAGNQEKLQVQLMSYLPNSIRTKLQNSGLLDGPGGRGDDPGEMGTY